jgi:ketosteroid isomerase-like protein
MSTTPKATLNEIKSNLAATNQLFNTEVFEKRNFDALDKIYTRDARVLPPGAPMITGQAAIKEFWTSMIQSTQANKAVLTSVDVFLEGDGAIEIGRATISMQPNDGQPTSLSVKYLVHWKEEDGLWKWNIDIWNQEP